MYENPDASNLEKIWGNILSRQPDRIRRVYLELSKDERLAVKTHLERMLQEPGWNDEQRISAQEAIQAIEVFTGSQS